ncbi:Unknown protein [Striga hermonthica]|uniref:Reverse transcriptase domain-containing protein n=1 Tax=Striga hermonthica TaxID=68872 RepID=A0A9N7MV16_STRHE|nr:Unknown protein [Striga hermonthica]
MANRLQVILPSVINEFQSAFVPGRLISDNIILGFETLHWMQNHRQSRRGYAALKLDMSKAYDRVEWNFSEAIVRSLGFDQSWVEKIMKCVRSVTFSFKLNQHSFGALKPHRGIRQGDPLSPYLFALVSQGLSSLLIHAKQKKFFRGIRIANNCRSISHLFFADDSLVFFRADTQDAVHIQNVLQIYEKALGQVINFDKSSLSFSPNTLPEVASSIKNVFKMTVVQGHEVYLGLHTFSARSKRTQFGYLKEKVADKIQSWRHKYFSEGGRKVLL